MLLTDEKDRSAAYHIYGLYSMIHLQVLPGDRVVQVAHIDAASGRTTSSLIGLTEAILLSEVSACGLH